MVVEDEGDVLIRLRAAVEQFCGQCQLNGDAALHVRGAPPVQDALPGAPEDQ